MAILGISQLGGPRIEMKTGRKDSKESYLAVVEDFIPNHNDSVSVVLSRFQSIGIDVEASVSLLGKYMYLYLLVVVKIENLLIFLIYIFTKQNYKYKSNFFLLIKFKIESFNLIL